MSRSGRITAWLASAPPALFATYAAAAGFSTYFCMYAYRKPFAAANYAGASFWGTDIALKTALVISQILGYAASKYVGVKVCSEITAHGRARALLALVGVAQLALLFFAILPPSWKPVAMFMNGLPLGMVWGLVVAYLEGRRTSELLLAGLSCSFIVASGVVKDIGTWLLESGVSESWMPFTTGLLFAPPFVLSVFLLSRLPAPSDADIDARTRRVPMGHEARVAFVKRFLPGLAMLILVYMLLTAYRDFRDNYGVEIFRELGYAGRPAIFTKTEVPVALGVMLSLAALNAVKDNRRGLFGAFGLMTFGALTLGGATLLLDAETIGGAAWMFFVGLGSYLVYVPFNSVLFDRMLAYTRVQGTAVFAIYVADALGYTGSIAVQLYRDIARHASTRLAFFRGYTYFMSVLAVLLLGASCWYFLRRKTDV